MNLIIFAAGVGQRLFPITEDLPKNLLKLNGETILDHQLKNFREQGITNITLITGHESEKLKQAHPELNMIYNPDYKTTNNIYSLWLAREQAKDGFLLINGDVIFHPDILKNLLNSEHENALTIDDSKELVEEDVKIKTENGIIKEINKTMNIEEGEGEYTGLGKFSKECSEIFFNKIEEYVNSNNLTVLIENPLQEILNQADIYPVSTNSLPWTEVDTPEDFEKAKILYTKIKSNE